MIQKATIADIKIIHGLLQEFAHEGELLPRPLSELYDHIRDFSVHINEEDNRVIGCCAFQICWEDLAEIRSLAVNRKYWGNKFGSGLVENAISEAKAFNIGKIFTLTYRPDFFKKFGFKQIDRSELPLKIWADCILCVKFPDCDETAMMLDLS